MKRETLFAARLANAARNEEAARNYRLDSRPADATEAGGMYVRRTHEGKPVEFWLITHEHPDASEVFFAVPLDATPFIGSHGNCDLCDPDHHWIDANQGRWMDDNALLVSLDRDFIHLYDYRPDLAERARRILHWMATGKGEPETCDECGRCPCDCWVEGVP